MSNDEKIFCGNGTRYKYGINCNINLTALLLQLGVPADNIARLNDKAENADGFWIGDKGEIFAKVSVTEKKSTGSGSSHYLHLNTYKKEADVSKKQEDPF